jgi:hypothetical protein
MIGMLTFDNITTAKYGNPDHSVGRFPKLLYHKVCQRREKRKYLVIGTDKSSLCLYLY